MRADQVVIVGSAALAVGLLLAVAVLVLRSRLVIVTVRGRSMEPTYTSGQRLLVLRRRLAAVRRGQVVVIATPASWSGPDDGATGAGGTWLVKRVAAVPGDSLGGHGPLPGTDGAAVVPAGHLLLLGDNPERSHDSRHVGFFPAGQLLGVVARPIRAD